MPEWSTVPTLEVWRKGSWVMFGRRGGDGILGRIDHLIEAFHGSTSTTTKLWKLVDLFFTTDYWLKLADAPAKSPDESAQLNTSRRDAVMKLYKAVVAEMVVRTGVTINRIPDWLQVSYGKQMEAHGFDVDNKMGAIKKLKYLDAGELAATRLHFKDGLAHRKIENRLVRVESTTFASDVILPGYAGFVMGLGRELYMDTHAQGSFFHSSYLAGGTVAAAGEIKISAGRVEAITPRSGHYRPSPTHMLSVIEALTMHGVDVSHVSLFTFDLQSSRTGTQVLADFDAEVRGLGDRAFRDTTRDAFRENERTMQPLKIEADRASARAILYALPAHEYERMRGHAETCKRKCDLCDQLRRIAGQVGMRGAQIGQPLADGNPHKVALEKMRDQLTARGILA